MQRVDEIDSGLPESLAPAFAEEGRQCRADLEAAILNGNVEIAGQCAQRLAELHRLSFPQGAVESNMT